MVIGISASGAKISGHQGEWSGGNRPLETTMLGIYQFCKVMERYRLPAAYGAWVKPKKRQTPVDGKLYGGGDGGIGAAICSVIL